MRDLTINIWINVNKLKKKIMGSDFEKGYYLLLVCFGG